LVVSRDELLNSVRHKLRLASYHGETLLAVLEQNPLDDPEDRLRIALEAHLEGLAYTGTAATEKTIRSVNPDELSGQMSVELMIRAVRAETNSPEASFAGAFEAWWFGRERGTRFTLTARDLRNDAAHSVYDKAHGEGRWAMEIRNSHPILLDEFASGYLHELGELSALVADAEQLAAADR
jgi:hypothetical protein